jgi:uncharacterized protein YwgA
MKRKEWVLLALAAAAGEPLSPVQLQKSLFLLGKAFPKNLGRGYYKFEPYHYGPFDSAVYRDAEELMSEGLATVGSSNRGRWTEYSASLDGISEAAKIKDRAPSEAARYLERVVEWAKSLTFPQLVRAVYAEYPEYRKNSVFQG